MSKRQQIESKRPQADAALRFSTLLGRLLGRARLWALGHGLLRWTAAVGLLALAAAWAVGGADSPGALNGWGLSLSLAAATAVLTWRLLVRPWRQLRRPEQLAQRIERTADFANLVVAAEEAERRPDRWPDDTAVARELKRRLYTRAADVLALVTPAAVLPRRGTRLATAGLVVWVVLGTWAWVSGPAGMSRGSARLLWPQPPAQDVRTGGLFAGAGADFVVVGENVDLAGVDFGSRVGVAAVAEVRVGAGTWQVLDTRAVPVVDMPVGLPAPYLQWAARLDNVREDFSWRLRRGPRVSAARDVTVRHYPLLTELAARIVPPAYTGLPARELPRLPSWIEVPAGSRVELTGRVSHPVVTATLVGGDGDSLALAVDSLVVRGVVDVAADRSFRVDLSDTWDLTNQSPLTWEIAAVADQSPALGLTRPDDDGILPLSGELTLLVDAADDYGLAELRLLARTGAAHARDRGAEAWLGDAFWQTGAAPDDPGSWREIATASGPLRVRATRLDDAGDELRLRLRLDLRTDGLDLVAGDGIELLIEGVDNKRPRPANTGRSGTLRLLLPSAAEVLVTQAESSEARRDELEEMRRRSSELNIDLDRLTRELMKNPIPDWSRQQEMEAAIDRQQKLQQELARVAEQLQQELQNLAESQLTSEAQLRKAEEMSELLQPGTSDQLQDLLQKMDQGGGQATPEDVSRAMEEVARNQQDMARRLDAALAMLKRMAQEQELEGLTALLEQLMRKQQELADLSRELAARQEAEESAQTELAANDTPDAAGDEGEQSDQSQAGEDGGEPGEESGEETGDQQSGEEQSGEEQSGDEPSSDEQSGDQQSGDEQSGDQEAGQQQEGEQEDPAAPEPSAEELARRQEALEDELEQLQAKLEEALENLRQENAENPRESNQEMADALEQALQKMQEQQDSKGKASEQLSQMDPQEAARLQEEALRSMGSLYSVLLESQQAMQQAMQMEQVGNLRGLAADMLALSARQEFIVQQIPPQLRDLRSTELTRNQHRVQKAAAQVRQGLSEMMDVAPNRIMKLMGQLDGLIETLGEGLGAMNENRAPVARRYARDGLAEANRIVIGLLTEAQMQSPSGGGGGGGSPEPSLAEKLQQLAKEQAGLNGSMDELRRMLADRGISQEARSRMDRLGQQQAEMAERMGDLAAEERERPEGERLLGDLGELGRDMESIGTEIADGMVSEETLVRQERILSRMLDARNSVRRRDYTNRREAETSERLYAEQGGEDGTAPGGRDDPFRLRYQPLEQAPMEYRDLVRRYFAALDSLERTGGEAEAAPEPGEMP